MRVTSSAPGKVILFGEHFVVKGVRAIATAISLRVRVSLEPIGGDAVVIESRRLGSTWRARVDELRVEDREAGPFMALLEALKKRGFSIIPHKAVIESDIPIGAGLGSSAASAVAYAQAYATLHGSPLSHRELFEVTLESEKVAHGRPSGIDNMIAIHGGTIAYRVGEEPTRLDVGLDRMEGYTFIVMDTGVKRSTRAVVEHALRLAERNWDFMKHVYDAAEKLVSEAIQALQSGDAERIGELMNINHGLLVALGVSSIDLDYIVNKSRLCGALGAKLTGAGWGGSAIAIAPLIVADNVVRCVSEKTGFVSKIGVHNRGVLVEEA